MLDCEELITHQRIRLLRWYWDQTWAVFSKASGTAAASRFSGRFSGIENGTVGVDSGTGKTGNTKNQNGLQVVLKSISRGGANNRLAKRSVAWRTGKSHIKPIPKQRLLLTFVQRPSFFLRRITVLIIWRKMSRNRCDNNDVLDESVNSDSASPPILKIFCAPASQAPVGRLFSISCSFWVRGVSEAVTRTSRIFYLPMLTLKSLMRNYASESSRNEMMMTSDLVKFWQVLVSCYKNGGSFKNGRVFTKTVGKRGGTMFQKTA